LSEENSPDVAEAALEAGGAGYVIKSDAGRELLAAVKALREASGTLALDWWAGFFRRPRILLPGARLAQTSDLFQRRSILGWLR